MLAALLGVIVSVFYFYRLFFDRFKKLDDFESENPRNYAFSFLFLRLSNFLHLLKTNKNGKKI
jgi:hypothetical protein